MSVSYLFNIPVLTNCLRKAFLSSGFTTHGVCHINCVNYTGFIYPACKTKKHIRAYNSFIDCTPSTHLD